MVRRVLATLLRFFFNLCSDRAEVTLAQDFLQRTLHTSALSVFCASHSGIGNTYVVSRTRWKTIGSLSTSSMGKNTILIQFLWNVREDGFPSTHIIRTEWVDYVPEQQRQY